MAIPVAITTVSDVVANRLRPLVRSIDQDAYYPREIIRELGAAGAFAGLADGPFGLNDKLDLKSAIQAMTEISSICGATAFCCWCQSALIWYVRNTSNIQLQEKLLASLASGKVLGGTALSNPMKNIGGLEELRLTATGNATQGYVVSGSIPWVSNIEEGHPFGIVFATESGSVMALANDNMSGLTIRLNDNFEVMAGTATVGVKFREVKISPEMFLATDASKFLPILRPGFVLFQAGIGLGLISVAADLIDSSQRQQSRGLPSGLLATAEQLREQQIALTERTYLQAEQIEANVNVSENNCFQLRLDIAEAAIRGATAAGLVSGASGLVKGKRHARLLREAAFYGVLTPSLRHLSYRLAV